MQGLSWLASDAARVITGQVIVCDAGQVFVCDAGQVYVR